MTIEHVPREQSKILRHFFSHDGTLTAEVADQTIPFAPRRTVDFLHVYGGRAIEICIASMRTYWTVMFMYKVAIEPELSYVT